MSQTTNLVSVFVTTSPGLEAPLARELDGLGFNVLGRGRSGVELKLKRAQIEQLTASSRLAHRVLWRLGDLHAHNADELYRSVRGLLRWEGLIHPEQTLAVHATVRDTIAFRDSRYAGLCVKDAICDAIRAVTGRRPSVDLEQPDFSLRLSISRGRGVLSLDATGRESLHARGYRTDAGEAPIRETLAAGILAMVGWDAESPLYDPMCGSGTFLIEAALKAQRVLPGHLEHLRNAYAFRRWPGFRAERYEQWLASQKVDSAPLGHIHGGELDRGVLATARVNAERAGLDAMALPFRHEDARAADLTWATHSQSGFLVTNPPWGERLGDARQTYALLSACAERWHMHLPGWKAAVLVPDREAARCLGLNRMSLAPLEAGGREVLLATGTL